MFLEVIGALLPTAVGVALSPLPIIAMVLMLGTTRGRSQGSAFAVGWTGGLVVVSVAIVWLTGVVVPADEVSPAVPWVQGLLGVLLLGLALRQWRRRPGPDDPVRMPAWMGAVDTFGLGRTAAIGAALSGANPKNLALTAAAAATIGQAGLGPGATVVAIATFVILASVTVVVPLILYLAARDRSARSLRVLRTFMSTHNAAIMVVVLLLLGAKLLGNGVAAL